MNTVFIKESFIKLKGDLMGRFLYKTQERFNGKVNPTF